MTGEVEVQKKKIVLLGDGAVGKTSLVRKFVLDEFDDKYIVTIGAKLTKKELLVGDYHIKLMIWDVLGQKGYTGMQGSTITGAQGALLVADITRRDTLKSLVEYWVPQINRLAGPIPLVFLGNKSDLEDQRQISDLDLSGMAGRSKSPFLMTSAKTGLNVEKAFATLGLLLVSRNYLESSSLVAGARYKEISDTVDAADAIMEDFYQKYPDRDKGQAVMQRIVASIGMDFASPSKESLAQIVDRLETVEKVTQGPEAAAANRQRRLHILRSVRRVPVRVRR